MKNIFLISLLLISGIAQADVLQDFDGLGENKELFDTAKALHPDVRVNVVQERIVKRRNRLEIAPEIAMFAGGDAYLDTYSYGLTLNYHIVPWISIGARHNKFSNTLNKEGKNLLTNGDALGNPIVPDIDNPESTTMGLINLYPIYGKMNFFGRAITHFDVYFTAGYGDMQMESGRTPTWTAGGGVGFWWSQHFSTRFEVRHQAYEAQRDIGPAIGMSSTVASLQMGYIL